jgi:hypothetical protein
VSILDTVLELLGLCCPFAGLDGVEMLVTSAQSHPTRLCAPSHASLAACLRAFVVHVPHMQVATHRHRLLSWLAKVEGPSLHVHGAEIVRHLLKHRSTHKSAVAVLQLLAARQSEEQKGSGDTALMALLATATLEVTGASAASAEEKPGLVRLLRLGEMWIHLLSRVRCDAGGHAEAGDAILRLIYELFKGDDQSTRAHETASRMLQAAEACADGQAGWLPESCTKEVYEWIGLQLMDREDHLTGAIYWIRAVSMWPSRRIPLAPVAWELTWKLGPLVMRCVAQRLEQGQEPADSKVAEQLWETVVSPFMEACCSRSWEQLVIAPHVLLVLRAAAATRRVEPCIQVMRSLPGCVGSDALVGVIGTEWGLPPRADWGVPGGMADGLRDELRTVLGAAARSGRVYDLMLSTPNQLAIADRQVSGLEAEVLAEWSVERMFEALRLSGGWANNDGLKFEARLAAVLQVAGVVRGWAGASQGRVRSEMISGLCRTDVGGAFVILLEDGVVRSMLGLPPRTVKSPEQREDEQVTRKRSAESMEGEQAHARRARLRKMLAPEVVRLLQGRLGTVREMEKAKFKGACRELTHSIESELVAETAEPRLEDVQARAARAVHAFALWR